MDPDETGNHKNLLIVFHTQGVKNERMAQAVFEGATDDSIGGVFVRMRRALDADAEDLLWADGVIFGTPENFGYMSGALKVEGELPDAVKMQTLIEIVVEEIEY